VGCCCLCRGDAGDSKWQGERRGAALRKVVLWSAEEVLAGGEIVWACEGWIINRLCGEESFQPGGCCFGCGGRCGKIKGKGWGRAAVFGFFRFRVRFSPFVFLFFFFQNYPPPLENSV